MERVAIIGGGAWGTALAIALRSTGRDVIIWAYEAEVADAINTRHENVLFLPGTPIDPAVRATHRLSDAVAGADLVLLVTPAQHTRAIAGQVAPLLQQGTPIVICAKGIEQGTGALMSEVLGEVAPEVPVAVLSGPSFAAEVARHLPTAATLACADRDLGGRLITALSGRSLRLYLSTDVVGSQIGGAVKNVVAIACGIVIGRQLGENARAALIARGLAETVRLGLAKGASLDTFLGLSALGDLTLTCNSVASRNTSLGVELGRGERLEDILGARRAVTEGVFSASSVTALASRLNVEVPICSAVDGVLNHGLSIDDAIDGLLSRPFGAEQFTGRGTS